MSTSAALPATKAPVPTASQAAATPASSAASSSGASPRSGQAMPDPVSKREIESTAPATGEVLGRVQCATVETIDAAMTTARLAQKAWEGIGLRRRLTLIGSWQESLLHNRERLISTMVAEQGKPRAEAVSEVLATLELVAFQRRIAPRTLRPKGKFVSLLPDRRHWVEYRPYGVVLTIAPWNFPLILSVAPILSALIGGNTVIYKPSEYATQVAEAIAASLYEAGIPREVFHVLHGYGEVGAALIEAKPDRICFTGSMATGRKVAAAAGERLIPVTLELGGKDAAIVLEDADLDRTALGITWAGLLNAGQACLSIERVYVMRPIADQLVGKMSAVIDRYIKVGSGADRTTTMGAITTPAQMKIIDGQVQEAVAQGARVVTGGGLLQTEAGRFFAPTIITDVTPQMRLMTDETFGPVIPIVPVDSEAEAIRLANDTRYGLTASVWTRNRARGLAIARQMRVGNTAVNDHITSASAPQLPWGGVDDSGHGRTRGVEGLLEMVYTQAVSADRVALPSGFFWYPYTPVKLQIIDRLMQLRYSRHLGDRLRALKP